MTSSIDLCQRALDEVAADATISSLSQPSKESQVCARWYDHCRRALLSAAPWGFARRQLTLTELGTIIDDTSIQPWYYKYLYPANCLKVRYLVPTVLTTSGDAVLTGDFFVNTGYGSYRGSPFKVGNELNGSASRKVVLTNLQAAVAVYVVDEETVDLFDSVFTEALVSLLAAKIAMPLSASKELAKLKFGMAAIAVAQARTSDANETMATTDHVPDWMLARGLLRSGNGSWLPGSYVAWDDIHWGM